ncbi:MAG: toxin YdaT family protein [Hafnia sp.]
MKISPPVELVAAELEQWAAVAGWKTVAGLVAGAYHANGGGDLLPCADCAAGLRNAIQRVQRIYRGCDGPRYYPQAEMLKPVVLSVLPAETRARLESPGDPVLLAALAAKEGIEAVNAVNLGAAPACQLKEIDEAIAALVTLKRALPFRELGLCA